MRGPDDLVVESDLNGLARFYEKQNRYAEAEPPFKQALAILEKAYGPDDHLVAYALNSLAKLYDKLGQDALAEPLFKRALAIDEKALAMDASFAGLLGDFAEFYEKRVRYAEAGLLYERALTIWEQVLGPDDLAVGAALEILLSSIRRRVATPRPSRSSSGRWRSPRRRAGPMISRLRRR